MNARFLKGMFVRVVVCVMIASFVLSGVPVAGYSQAFAASNMKVKSTSLDGGRLDKIIRDKDLNGQQRDGGGLNVKNLDALKTSVQKKNIDSGFIALDWNIKAIKKAEDLERIIKSLDTIKYVFEDMNAQYLYGFTHRQKPKGIASKEDIKPEESLKDLVDQAKKLLAEKGLSDVIVELLPFDNNLEEEGKRIEELKAQNPGKKIFFVFENIRFYKAEQSKDENVRKAFELKLISLTGRDTEKLFYINEAFDKSHRDKDASMELVKSIPGDNTAAGKALEKDLNAVLNFLDNLKGKMVLVVGGKKFDKLKNIADIAEARGENLIIVLVGAQVNPWRAYKKLSIGNSLMPAGEEAVDAQKAFEKIEGSGAQIITPVDFTLGRIEKYVDTKGKEKTRIVPVSRDQKEIPSDLMQVDIGSETIRQLKDLTASLQSGDGFIMNGGTGTFDEEDEVLSEGTFSMIDFALESQMRNVANLGAGGDMFEALKKYSEKKKINAIKMIDYTTGGGVVWALIAKGPEKLPPIKAVLKTAKADTQDGGTVSVSDIFFVLSNMIRLGKGARTGQYNAEHAILERAQGGVQNHSEPRGVLENKMENLLKRVESMRTNTKDEIESVWREGLAMEDLLPAGKKLSDYKPDEMKVYQETLEILNAFLFTKQNEGVIFNDPYRTQYFSRTLVNKIINAQLKAIISDSKKNNYTFSQTVLCVGETLAQYEAKSTQAVIEMDLKQMLEGISIDDIKRIGLRIAYEPRWAIGTGKTPTNEEIQTTHRFIKATLSKLIGVELGVDYGGSLKSSNALAILSLPDVNGGLIGGSAKDVEEISKIIRIAAEVGKANNKILNIGMNWKAEVSSTGLADLAKFAEGFKGLFIGEDLSNVRIVISTPQVKLVQDSVQKPLEQLNTAMIKAAGILKIAVKDLRGGLLADSKTDSAKEGNALDEYTKSLLVPQVAAEKILDSRGRPTVRATISLGLGVEAVGEVPAGASTGSDEANTVGAEQAIKNIVEIIGPMLAKANLDLRKHSDLLKAEDMIAAAAGENYKILGADAVVPVSWALWETAAKLNNMELWEYIRKFEPEAVGNGKVLFFANIFNGGLHAIKEGEKLGIDRIDIQEIMSIITKNMSMEQRLAFQDKLQMELRKLLLAKYLEKDVTTGDEAGFTVKGLGSSEEAIALVVQAMKNVELEPGKDVKLALDVAATTFYNEAENVYEFQGKKLSSREMIDFYIALAKKYPGLIYSIEDGLAENDWEGWKVFTAEMKKLGIITIGDDLFVTQMARLKRGVLEESATGILIKVNQNGSVKGTIEEIKYARANDLQVVVSHRSGETLFAGIADLAYAVKAEGIKTGATQPEELFPDENTWVRRNKYLRLVEIAKKVADKVFGLKKEQALIISTDYIKESGIKPVSYLDKLTNRQIIVAGRNASKIIKLLGLYGADTKNMMIASDPEAALSKAKAMGISAERTTVVLSTTEKFAFSFPVGVTLITGDGLVPAEELGMAAYAGSRTEAAKKGLETLDQKIAGKVITKETKKSLAEMLAELNSGMLSFTDETTLTEEVAKKVAQVESVKEKFLKNI